MIATAIPQPDEAPAGVARRAIPAAVRCRHVTKVFPTRTALRGVDLDIAPGEAVAIVGRSGCGKSTLLRLLTGLEPPTTGAIAIAGEELSGLNPHVRVMFQDPCLLPWRSVIRNVALGLPPEHCAAAAWALDQVGLADRARDWPKTLSGGQRQRVALARALASRPGLLLLDEPLGALDALTRLEMQLLIARLWRDQGFTLVLVTHDVDEAVLLADRVLVMESGRWTAEIPVDLPREEARGRDRGAPGFIRAREQVLAAVMGGGRADASGPA